MNYEQLIMNLVYAWLHLIIGGVIIYYLLWVIYYIRNKKNPQWLGDLQRQLKKYFN